MEGEALRRWVAHPCVLCMSAVKNPAGRVYHLIKEEPVRDKDSRGERTRTVRSDQAKKMSDGEICSKRKCFQSLNSRTCPLKWVPEGMLEFPSP